MKQLLKLSSNDLEKLLYCKCCNRKFEGEIDKELLKVLELIRTEIGEFIIVEGYRCEIKCERERKSLYGSPFHSPHFLGKACHIKFLSKAFKHFDMISKLLLKEYPWVGVGFYVKDKVIHIDTLHTVKGRRWVRK
jgi:uncharacterized protein YcbK (DUF882 family)